jgi:phi13 family phage major tail protein
MRTPKFWPISTPRVDGSPITYGTPVTIGPAVSANVTFDTADNPDYGDDVIIDNDKGVNGYSVSLETNDISKEARAACLGWVPKTGTGTTVTHYEVTDAAPPEGGLSFIRVKMFKGVRKYEAFFFHALQFSDGGENASTKEKQITWNHPTMDGAGIGVYIDSSGNAKYFNWMEFDTEAAATAWINSQGGASSGG